MINNVANHSVKFTFFVNPKGSCYQHWTTRILSNSLHSDKPEKWSSVTLSACDRLSNYLVGTPLDKMSIIVVSLVMLMSLEVAHGLAFVNWNTTTGPVTGFLDGSVKVFWGIPFAKPPVGPGRFKPPEKVANWSIPVNATQRPNACWQNIDSSFNRSPKVEMWNPNTKM
ncbi:cholinesterase isoform X1, partial [Biomphalaria glabrata]